MLRIQKIKSRNCYTFKQQTPSIEGKPQGSAMTLFIWAMLLLAHDVPLPFMRGQVSDLQSLFCAKLKVNPRTTLTAVLNLSCHREFVLFVSQQGICDQRQAAPWAPFAGLLLQTRGQIELNKYQSVINLNQLESTCQQKTQSQEFQHTFRFQFFNLNLAHLPNSQSSPDIHALHWCWRIASCALVASIIKDPG